MKYNNRQEFFSSNQKLVGVFCVRIFVKRIFEIFFYNHLFPILIKQKSNVLYFLI